MRNVLGIGALMTVIGGALAVSGLLTVWKGSPPSEAFASEAAVARWIWRLGVMLLAVGVVVVVLGANLG